MKINECGRSMIEMLGVLAIVGILSVGGIAGYSKAMMKYKNNKLTEEFAFLLDNMLQYEDQWKQAKKRNGDAHFYIAEYLDKARLLPEKWTRKGYYIYDTMGGRTLILVYHKPDESNHNRLIVDYFLPVEDRSKLFSLCSTLFQSAIIPYHASIYQVSSQGRAESEDPQNNAQRFLGDNYCNRQRSGYKCVRDITINDISAMCEFCSRYNKQCYFSLAF